MCARLHASTCRRYHPFSIRGNHCCGRFLNRGKLPSRRDPSPVPEWGISVLGGQKSPIWGPGRGFLLRRQFPPNREPASLVGGHTLVCLRGGWPESRVRVPLPPNPHTPPHPHSHSAGGGEKLLKRPDLVPKQEQIAGFLIIWGLFRKGPYFINTRGKSYQDCFAHAHVCSCVCCMVAFWFGLKPRTPMSEIPPFF